MILAILGFLFLGEVKKQKFKNSHGFCVLMAENTTYGVIITTLNQLEYFRQLPPAVQKATGKLATKLTQHDFDIERLLAAKKYDKLIQLLAYLAEGITGLNKQLLAVNSPDVQALRKKLVEKWNTFVEIVKSQVETGLKIRMQKIVYKEERGVKRPLIYGVEQNH